ncbi:MAG: AraC family transcriptional regulator [Pseudomonadota bacterium]
MSDSQQLVFSWDDMTGVSNNIAEQGIYDWYHKTSQGSVLKHKWSTEFVRSEVQLFEFKNKSIVGLIGKLDPLKSMTVKICDGDWIRFNYAPKIDVSIRGEGLETVRVRDGTWQVFNFPPDQITYEDHAAGAYAEYITICCKPEILRDLTASDSQPLAEELDRVFKSDLKEFVHKSMVITSNIERLVHDLMSLKETGKSRYYRMESLVLDLLLESVALLSPSDKSSHANQIADADREKIEQIKTVIIADLASPPSIEALVRKYGLNRKKLFYLFKELEGVSVSQFILREKMKLARDLILANRQSLQAIAHQLGYSYQNNFSAAFKDFYGYSPRSLRKELMPLKSKAATQL